MRYETIPPHFLGLSYRSASQLVAVCYIGYSMTSDIYRVPQSSIVRHPSVSLGLPPIPHIVKLFDRSPHGGHADRMLYSATQCAPEPEEDE